MRQDAIGEGRVAGGYGSSLRNHYQSYEHCEDIHHPSFFPFVLPHIAERVDNGDSTLNHIHINMKKNIIILIATLLAINTSSYLRADLTFVGPATFNVNSPSSFSGDVTLTNNAIVYINNVSFGNNGNLYVLNGSSFINYGLTYLYSNFISGSIAGNNSFYDGNLFFNQGSSINLPINSFVGNPYTNWNLFDALGADLTSLSKNNPLTINLTGSSGKGNGGGSYSFDFMRLTNAIPDFDPSKWSVNTSQFALDSSLAGGSWSVSQQAYPQFMGGGQSSLISVTYTIPEPSTYALFGIGAIGLERTRHLEPV
jgi:hypothetical protein